MYVISGVLNHQIIRMGVAMRLEWIVICEVAPRDLVLVQQPFYFASFSATSRENKRYCPYNMKNLGLSYHLEVLG